MPSSFSVNVAPNPLSLDARRLGAATVRVSNLTDRSCRGRLRLSLLGATQRDWLAIEGEAERRFGPRATEAFQVQLSVAASAPPGTYVFRPDVIGVENPDEDSLQGPQVSFRVAPWPVPHPAGKGYLATLLGAAAGALVAGLLGTLPATLFLINTLHTSSSNADFWSAIATTFVSALLAAFLFILGVVAGLCVGPAVGSYVALRVRNYQRPGRTAILLGVLDVVSVVVFGILLGVLFGHTKGGAPGIVLALGYLLCVAVPPLAARAAVLLWTTGRV